MTSLIMLNDDRIVNHENRCI